MSEGYIKIGKRYITVWRLLYWLVMLVTLVITSPIVVPFGFIALVFVFIGITAEHLKDFGFMLGSIVGNVFANRVNVFLVNGCIKRHLDMMPWKQDKDDDL